MINSGVKDIYYNGLNLERFSFMLDNNSQCYKFYWLEALVNLLVLEGKNEITYFEAAAEMITEAWYTVSEYHLHMGSRSAGRADNGAIERAVNALQDLTGLKSNADSRDVRKAVFDHAAELKDIMRQMTDDVPYRLLSPFLSELKGNDKLWHSDRRLIAYISFVDSKNSLPYSIRYESGLQKTVIWNRYWADMIKDNYLLIQEWIRSKKIRYLQDRNPGVPGIIYKLDIETSRKLNHVHKLWDAIMEREEVHDIYTGSAVNGTRYDIDHFIPWSYVASDELWNLTPSQRTSNSQKSNNLPDWETYFSGFLSIQHQLKRNIQAEEQIYDLFEKCRNDNLNTLWAGNLYQIAADTEFDKTIEENMKPIWQAAKLQGYATWLYTSNK